jgi:hypothetical protein
MKYINIDGRILMKKIIKSATFWFGLIAFLLVLGRIFIYSSSQGQNVLKIANLPLLSVLQTFFPDIINPGAAGAVSQNYFVLSLPYYFLFVITYIGYGLLIDLIIHKIKNRSIKN